jgi:hypothetical protein
MIGCIARLIDCMVWCGLVMLLMEFLINVFTKAFSVC